MSPIRPPMPRSALTPQDCLKVATDAWEDLLASFKGQTEYTPGDPDDSIPAPNFWQVGCAFDTMLDYVWLLNDLGTPMSPDDLKSLMTLARNGYEYGIGCNAAVWYDDWAWYGIAASKAFDPAYMDFFGGQLDFFQNVALNMWGLIAHGKFDAVADSIPADSDAWRTDLDWPDQLTQDGLKARGQYHHGTTHTWDNIKKLQDQDSFFNTPGKNWAVPRFDGGAWQYDMYASQLPLDYKDGNAYKTPNPADLGPPYQGPFQFSLMTGLYVVLAQRLAQAARIKDQLAADGRVSPDVSARLGSESYDDAVAASVKFIDDWFAVDQGDYSWVRKIDASETSPAAILFRERAPTYAKPPSIPDDRGIYVDGYPVVPGFKTDNFWCGDQGLFLGALVAQGRLDQARKLVSGVQQWLTCPCRWNVVIGFTPSSFPDHGDYASGSGIFWRYVLYACRTNADFRSWMIHEEMALFDNIVVASVSNTWTEATGLFQPFNTVAVGVAACYLLNEAAKAPNPPEARGSNPFSRRK